MRQYYHQQVNKRRGGPGAGRGAAAAARAARVGRGGDDGAARPEDRREDVQEVQGVRSGQNLRLFHHF